MAARIPVESCCVLKMETFLWEVKNAAGYHPGPVTPSTADGAPLSFKKAQVN